MVEQDKLNEITAAICTINRNQKLLMKEFIHLRDNHLNLRNNILTGNKKSNIPLPFNEMDSFLKFELSLNEESESQLVTKNLNF